MVLRLVLVRHGLSSYNKKGLIQGRTDDSYLTDEGYAQAKITGQKLNQIKFDEVFSSPLKRAAETAKTIEQYLDTNTGIQYDKNLLEVDLDEWSGFSINEIKNIYKDSYKIWKNDPENLSIQRKDNSTFEPIKDLFVQAENFIKSIKKNNLRDNVDKNILIIAHNAILRSIILYLIKRPHKGFRKIKLDNSSISIINIIKKEDSDLTQIECLNQTSHLKKNIPNQIGDSRIILVRHGETDWNKEGRFQGQIDIPLNEQGKGQAKKANQYLKDIKFTKAFSSSMLRPYQTAEIILGKENNLKIERIDKLVEISHGLWEGKLEEEIEQKWPKMIKDWHKEPQKVIMPEGESIKQVSDRSINAWYNILEKQDKNDITLVVAHDAVNKTLLCHILGLDYSNIWMIKQGNGGINVIDVFNDPSKDNVLSSLNITNHLGNIIDVTASGAL